MSAEIFVSYARDDRERVMPLVDRLRQAGVSVWVDEGGIHGATLWGKEIVEAIRNAKVLVLVATRSSFDSRNVVKEVAIASEWDKPILPVYLEPVEVPDTLHYQLAGIQHVEYFQGREDAAFDVMLSSLARLEVVTSSEPIATTTTATPASHPSGHHPPAYTTTSSSSANKNSLVIGLLVLAVIGLALALVFRPGGTPEAKEAKPGTMENTQPTGKPANEAPSAGSSIKRIAVLPFRNIGPAQENNFLAEGMHGEIDAMLSIVPSLMVKDASRFKNSANDPKSIGESLQVDAIVTGSVRQAVGQLRVIVKLVDTRTEANLWTKTFDKSEGDVFAVQREIAQSVAEGLQLNLDAGFESNIARRQTQNLEAYNLYLHGRKLWNQRSRESMRDSIEKFDLALAKDSGFVLAHVGIADAYNQLVRYGFSPSLVAYPKAKLELEKALALNDNLSEAHASLGWVQFNFDWDWVASEQSFKRALEINPNNPEARRWYSHLLRILNRGKEALREIDQGIRLEPHSPIMRWGKANALVLLGKNQEAIDSANKAYELDPRYLAAIQALIEAHTANGDHSKALELAEKGIGEHNNHSRYLVSKALALARLGQKGDAEIVLSEITERSREVPVPKSSIALIHCHLGDHDAALRLLEEALSEKGSYLAYSSVEGDWHGLYDNLRFQAIWSKMGLPLRVKP